MAVEERLAAMTARLDARHQARKDERTAAQEATDAQASPEEKVQKFEQDFKFTTKNIEAALAGSGSITERAAITTLFDDLDNTLATANKMVADSAHFLPSFDVRHSQQKLKELEAAIEQARLDKLPKKKFAFKGKRSRQKAAIAASQTTPASTNLCNTTAMAEGRARKQLSYHNLTDQSISITAEESNAADLSLKNLTRCQVYIKGSPDAFHISQLANCKLCIGPVTRSLLIDGCNNCQFSIACQQLRVHNAYNSRFYIHVTSRAIIEDCDQLKFAPYNWKYDTLEADYKASGLDPSINHWAEINDFKWLDPKTPSPHWQIMPESERIIEREEDGSR